MTKEDTKYVRDTLENSMQDHRHGEILAWLSKSDFSAQQSDVLSRRQEGTGNWFIRSDEFQSWLRQPNGTLFCPGMPGAGKTMISAIAIDHISQDAHVDQSKYGLAYLYCNYKAQGEQTALHLLSTIVQQLVHFRPSAIGPVTELYDQHTPRKTRPTLEEIVQCLQRVLSEHSAIYLIIDALDECQVEHDTRNTLLRTIQSLQNSADLRLMVTSRFNTDIQSRFTNTACLEVRAAKEDVRRYIICHRSRLPRCIQNDDELFASVQTTIADTVDGMSVSTSIGGKPPC